MQLQDKIGVGGIGKFAMNGSVIDNFLYAVMRCGFGHEISLIVIAFASLRALDILRTGAVPLDEVAVIGVHQSHEAGEMERGLRLKCSPKTFGLGCYFGDEIGQIASRCIDPCWLNLSGGFDIYRHCFGRSY